MNDSYTNEFLIFIKGILEFGEIDENIQEFNILDLLLYNNKINNINKLNIEINTLDFTSFENVLNIIYNNNNTLTSINLSFFSSNITYYTQSLYKLFKEHNDENILKSNYKNNYLYDANYNIDETILNKFSSNYTYNLKVLFDIIKNMANLDELGLNFDIPDNILNNQNYMNPILKFIINILIYSLNNSKFRRVCLLSPRTFFDNRKIPNINNLINNMNNNNNSLLKDLSLQFQFHQISNINNFVSTNLEILNIGDLDIFTFKLLCDNICNPNFNLNSSLQKLSIGLLNSIIDFNTEIKHLLRKLFSVKFRHLTNLNLYSNIIIGNDMEYDYLFQILNYNWIYEYTLLFNIKSKKIMARISEDINKLQYFVPHNLEKELLNSNDIMNMKHHITLEINNNKDYYDDAFWYLKYLLEYVYVDKMKNEKKIKNIIMGILKYLYILKTPKINLSNSQLDL